MRRKDREVTDRERINEIIQKSKICRVGFQDNGDVYIVPLNFGFAEKDGKQIFYFHSAKEGRKVDLVKTSPHVGFELDTGFELREAETACAFSAGYQSIIGNGMMSIVDGYENKKEALNEIMYTNTGKRNWEFDEKMLEAVGILKLEVTELSCKEHII